MKSKQFTDLGAQAATRGPASIRAQIEKGTTRPAVARKLQGYEAGNPRCGNCKEFIKRGTALKNNSCTKLVELYCGLGHFSVKEGGCCDLWVGSNGDTL